VPLNTSLKDAEELLHKHRIEKLLVVDADGDLAGLITVKDIKKKQQFPNSCKDKNGRLRVLAAIGVTGDTHERAKELINVDVDALVVDTAHGHSKGVLDTIAQLKSQNSNVSIIAGNIATGYGAKALIDAGVDCIKVGIGAGASCTTRIVAGVGVPQLTAIMDAVEVSKKENIPVIADGGLRYSGDIAKALAAGADSIMLGSVLAGMNESPGETILYEGRQYKTFRGMGSLGAMEEGSGDRYFQEDTDNKKLVPEGIEGMVPYRGPVKNTIHQLTGGIKSSMGYCGCKTIEEFGTKSEFIEITPAGVRESHPHEVRIVKEAPNYSASDS
jgi:IMP dehydrogenase